MRVYMHGNVQFYLRTRRTLVASAWLSLSHRRAVTSGRAHEYARSRTPEQPIAREIGAVDRSRWVHIRTILHAYMQRFLGIGALRCRADASCGTKPASKLRATIRWQSAVIHMHAAGVWWNRETWPDTLLKIINVDWFSYTGCLRTYIIKCFVK